MSFLTPNAAGERAVLTAFLIQQIGQVRTTLHGLTVEQVHQRSTASELTLASLSRHVCEAVGGWLDAVAAAPGAPARPAGAEDDWTIAPTVGPDELRAELDAIAARVSGALASVALDVAVPVPDMPWFPPELGSWEARWVFQQLIAEVARHAGHADIIRESIDGKGAYELNDRADGVIDEDAPWPPAW